MITADEFEGLNMPKRRRRYARLTDEQVRAARRMRQGEDRLSIRAIARIFGCGVMTIHDIVTGKIRS